MKICMPVDQLNGLDSEISPNFRAAPALMVIDSESRECFGIDAASGTCRATPQHIDAIVYSGGIGRGMFNGLRSRGVRVFSTDAITVAEALDALLAGRLEDVIEVDCCSSGQEAHQAPHEHGQNCGCSSQHDEASDGCGCSGHH